MEKLFLNKLSDHGTLGPLIKRIPAAKKPKKDMNACTDALFTVFKGHILPYACQELGIENVDSEIAKSSMKLTTDVEK